MPCDVGTDREGHQFIICSRQRRRRCGEPGCREWSSLLCDYALTGSSAGKTCDRPLCTRHAHRIDDVTRVSGGLKSKDSIDYCPSHFQLSTTPLAPAANDDASAQLTLGERAMPRPSAAPPARTSAQSAQELLRALDTVGGAR